MEKEIGKCPKCDSEIIQYGEMENADSCIYYPFTCNVCKFEGREWYDLAFSGFSDSETGEDIE